MHCVNPVGEDISVERSFDKHGTLVRDGYITIPHFWCGPIYLLSMVHRFKNMNNIDTVKKMYELFATKDYEAIKKIFDKNIRWNQMRGFPGGGQYIGAEPIFEKVFDGFRKDWTDWKATITRYIDSGDGVFVVGCYEGTYKATGRSMQADFACEYKVKEGKITEFNQYTDTLLIGQAMGLMRE